VGLIPKEWLTMLDVGGRMARRPALEAADLALGGGIGTKDNGGSKASKKPAQKDITQKREAKRNKKGK
jgi:hypothetical protein